MNFNKGGGGVGALTKIPGGGGVGALTKFFHEILKNFDQFLLTRHRKLLIFKNTKHEKP